MLKILISAIATALLAAVAASAGNVKTIWFDDVEFVLRLTGSACSELVNEYIPIAESNSWQRLIAVRWFPELLDHRESVGSLIQSVRAHNPMARYSAWQVNGENATGVDFITWQDNSFVEFNVYIYRANQNGTGLIAHQYAMRAYGDDRKTFMESLPEMRQEMIEMVIAYDFPKLVGCEQ